MLEIKELYGVEVIVHIKAMGDNRTPGGVLMPTKIPEWLEATVILVGKECKKGLIEGDVVIIDRTTYNESPNLSKSQFNFPSMDNGEFKIMTEYRIVMKVSSKKESILAPVLNPDTIDNVSESVKSVQRQDL
jgi:hypothetical protein